VIRRDGQRRTQVPHNRPGRGQGPGMKCLALRPAGMSSCIACLRHPKPAGRAVTARQSLRCTMRVTRCRTRLICQRHRGSTRPGPRPRPASSGAPAHRASVGSSPGWLTPLFEALMHRHGRHCEEVDARLAGTFCGHRNIGVVVVAVAGCLPRCRERSVLSSRWGTPSPAGRPRNTCEGNLRRMPGDPPMRRLRDPVRRTVRRVGWAVGAGTRRLGARTWPGAGGRTDSQRRPEQQGKRDPVTLPRPDLPVVLLSHRGPVSFGRDGSARTASRGAGWLRRSPA